LGADEPPGCCPRDMRHAIKRQPGKTSSLRPVALARFLFRRLAHALTELKRGAPMLTGLDDFRAIDDPAQAWLIAYQVLYRTIIFRA